jgi:glycosyltransferase involved in cell wall biosynthesis
MVDCAVLHVTSLPGGGVDRHVRDIARATPRHHLIWHVSDTADVIEDPRTHRYLPLDAAALAREPAILADWLRAQRVGIVHTHSVGVPARMRSAWAADALGAPTLVTLHDVLFLRREGFEPGAPEGPDPAWLAQTAPFLRAAARVLAPSEYLAGTARRHVEGLALDVVANGSPTRAKRAALAPRAEFAARRPKHVVGVLGAIGPHKGARALEALAARLDGSDIAIVVVGYLDTQILHGWHMPNLFVHGAYADEDVSALFAAYRAELALFPNRVPESFSYALSDVWAAGLPAVVPPEGALAERVRRHGGGWLLPAAFGERDIHALLARLLSVEGREELARVKSQLERPDPARIPSLDAMAHSLDALYARYGIEPAAPIDPQSPAVQKLLATQLDGTIFRAELVRLAEALADQPSNNLRFETEARAWIAKLERDVADLQADLRSRSSLATWLAHTAWRAWRKLFDARS